MTAEQHLSELVEQLRSVVGGNLVAVVLHGSAATEEFQPEYSDLNVLCVVNDLSASAMRTLSPVLGWWAAFRYPAPLFFTLTELQISADVFPIEMLDIKERHKVLQGEDIFRDLQVPMALHRVQLEHELRTKLLFLRQHYMSISGDAARLRGLMLDSVANFLALFRHALIAMGENTSHRKNEVAQRAAAKLGFDPAPFEQLLQVREHKLKPERLDPDTLFAAYLRAIDIVVKAVDSLS
jgi:predicted nucleotidyltransferase